MEQLPNQYSVALSLLTLIPFFSLGYEVSFTLNAMFVRNDLHLTEIKHNNVVNVEHRIGIAAAIIAGIALNYAGRRSLIVFGLSCHFVGALLASMAGTFDALMATRVLMGLSFGVGLTSGPIYVAEIAPAAHRGLLISLSQLLFTAGKILGLSAQYLAQAYLSTHSGWRLVVGIEAIPSFLVLVGIVRFPCFFSESPSWLVIKGRLAQAAAVMERCGAPFSERRTRMDQLTYIAGIPVAHTNNHEVQVPSIFVTMKKMWTGTIVRPFFRTVVFLSALHAFQFLSGAEVAVWIGDIYFEENGIHSLKTFMEGDLMAAGERMAVSLFPILMIDKIGRKWVLIASIAICICTTGIFGGFALAGKLGAVGQGTVSRYCVVMVMLLQAAYTLGLGCVPWVYGPESLEFIVRGPAVGLAVAVNQGAASFLMEKLVGVYLRIDVGGIFLICCGMMCAAFVSCLLFFIDMHNSVLIELGHLAATPYGRLPVIRS